MKDVFLIRIIYGFVKSPTAVRHAHGPEQSRRAALRFIFRHCGVLVSTPHSSRFASLAFGAFYFAVPFLTFYEFIIYAFKNLANDSELPKTPREIPAEMTPPMALHGKKENAMGPK
jgi:hypothetical protein